MRIANAKEALQKKFILDKRAKHWTQEEIDYVQ